MLSPPPYTLEEIPAWCNELYNELLHFRTIGQRVGLANSTTSTSSSGTGEDNLLTATVPQNFNQTHNGLLVKAAGTKTKRARTIF
jgi:hypothetical protein